MHASLGQQGQGEEDADLLLVLEKLSGCFETRRENFHQANLEALFLVAFGGEAWLGKSSLRHSSHGQFLFSRPLVSQSSFAHSE